MPEPVAVGELVDQLSKLSVDDTKPLFPGSFPHANPQDIYRQHITQLLHEASGVDPKIIYPTIQWTSSLDKGDFTVAVPALRIKGKKPDALATELATKVSHLTVWREDLAHDVICSFPSRR